MGWNLLLSLGKKEGEKKKKKVEEEGGGEGNEKKKKRPGEELPKTSKELAASSPRLRRARAMLEPRVLREPTAAATAEGTAAGMVTAGSAVPAAAEMAEKKKDGNGRKGRKGKGPGKKPAPPEEGEARRSSTGKPVGRCEGRPARSHRAPPAPAGPHAPGASSPPARPGGAVRPAAAAARSGGGGGADGSPSAVRPRAGLPLSLPPAPKSRTSLGQLLPFFSFLFIFRGRVAKHVFCSFFSPEITSLSWTDSKLWCGVFCLNLQIFTLG